MRLTAWIFGDQDVPVGWRIMRTLLLCLAMFFVSASVAGYIWLRDLGVFRMHDQLIAAITDHSPSDNSIVFDKDGNRIGEFFNQYHIYVPYENMPRSLIRAVLAIEDRNFFRHEGVDFRGIMRAALDTIRGGQIRQGASTITQQLVRNLVLTRERAIDRKVMEIVLSVQLERQLTKQRILELYLNSLFLGHGSYGVGAAAFRYFGKDLSELKAHETALIAGLFQSPSNYNPHRFPNRAKLRQRQVILAMYRSRMIDRDEAKSLIGMPLEYNQYEPIRNQIAPYFIDYIRDQTLEILANRSPENRGLRIYTTLDASLQEAARATIVESEAVFERAEKSRFGRRHHQLTNDLPPSHPVEAALLSIHPETGAILAMVGGRDYAVSKFNRTAQALRSPGSAFKPVVYSLALEQGMKWSDMFYVSPVSVNSYQPRNYSNDFLTETTMLRAFYRSLNTTAVDIGRRLGLDRIINHARKLGVETPLKEELGTVLGSSEVTMLDMARMYSTFANGGYVVSPFAISKITDRDGNVVYEHKPDKVRKARAISPQIAYLTLEGLRSVLQFGTATSASHHALYAGGKTGTSNESQDNWFSGVTRALTTIVWLGTDDNAPLLGRATGGSFALPIWDRFMQKVAQGKLSPLERFRPPPGITSARVHARFGHLASNGIPMYFLEGHAPKKKHSDLEEIGYANQFRTLFDQY